jgi:hypothetical protein
VVEGIKKILLEKVKWLKVSSVSRGKKLEREGGAGAAKLMKPHHELNLNGRIGF